MRRSQHKTSLIASLILLGSALMLLSGCSWENQPAAESKPAVSLPLDKLKTETSPTPPSEPAKVPAPLPSQSPTPMTKKQYPNPPALTIDSNKTYTATLTTDKGVIEVALDAKATPITVNNFVFLAREKFYDGTVFHRAMNGFMIQGGDPLGTGFGDPGYKFNDEPVTENYTRGTIAMANSGRNTNGSQFFIMHKDAFSLPKNYVIFGHVTKGLEVVDAIATAPAVDNGKGEISKPVTPVVVKTVTITEK